MVTGAGERVRIARIAGVAMRYGLATVGACTLAGIGLIGCMRRTMYVTDRIGSVPSPDGRLRVVGEVTRGGFGTVWTTRLFIEARDGRRMMIYKNGDSDFVPKVRWMDAERVTVVIGCGRADHLANPAAWADGTTPYDRVRIRWSYDALLCARAPRGDE